MISVRSSPRFLHCLSFNVIKPITIIRRSGCSPAKRQFFRGLDPYHWFTERGTMRQGSMRFIATQAHQEWISEQNFQSNQPNLARSVPRMSSNPVKDVDLSPHWSFQRPLPTSDLLNSYKRKAYLTVTQDWIARRFEESQLEFNRLFIFISKKPCREEDRIQIHIAVTNGYPYEPAVPRLRSSTQRNSDDPPWPPPIIETDPQRHLSTKSSSTFHRSHFL